MAGTNTNRLANLNGSNFVPVQAPVLPPLPDKIARIDPDGSARWLGDANKALADWVQTLNVGNQAFQNSIK